MVSIVFGDRQNMFKTILCLNFWFLSSFAYVFADNREKVIRCIAGNVTMQFKPELVDDTEVKTYVWNKVRGVNKDPSFAKFEPSVSSQLEIYYNEEHQVQNRLIHYPDEPATLYLTNLRKSDQQQYTLALSYVDYIGTPTEYIIDLEVQDVCFEKPKEVGKCAVTTCYTGDNGVLKTPDGAKQTVMGYKQVKVCDEATSGNYSCCNAAGTCLVQPLQESTDPKELMSCKDEQIDGILWNTAMAGKTLKEPCPRYQKGVATRFCDEHGEWEPPNFINCTNEALVNASSLLESIIGNETQDQIRIQETVNYTLQLMKNLTSSTNGIGAGDLSSSLGVLEKIVTVTNATGLPIEKEVMYFYAVIDNILSPNNSNSWTTVSKETEKDPSFLLKNMDRFSKITLQNDNITTTKFNGSNFELVINRANIDETGIRFPDEQSNNVSLNSEELSTFLKLPKQSSNATKAINYVAVLYRTISDILGSDSNSKGLKGKQGEKSKQRSFVNSPILSITTQEDQGVLNPPLNLKFGHTVKNTSTEMRAVCVSWDFNLNKWSEEGCIVKQTNRRKTVCHCNHLTNFAILMRPYTQVSEESPFLKTMSLVGVALSIAFTFLTSLIYVLTWRFIRSDKNVMMLNICGSLILSYTIFISSVEQTSNEVACVAITAIIHYLFLVTFFSMLGLGVYYFMSITVTYYALYVANNFKSKSRVRWFLGGIWGIPVIITATNLGAFWGKGYHLKSYCWLSIESGSLYLFIIPVCLICLINILIIVSLLRVLFASSIVARSSLQRKASSGLRSLGTLLPVLGVTWLFGILAVNEHAVVFQYLFVIANSFQGFFIFVSHVLLDKKVRQGIWNRYPSLSTILSFTERGTKETTLSSQSPSTSKSNEPLMKPKKKSLLKRFRQTKVKKSALSMSEKTMSTSCPQSVSHAKRNETNSD
ncbi:adhesion G protein-coupled receptor E3-like [Crassostrea angulata]|uniref:adhesion G protein-coupled receptor E3-like n=1 Tax=Magallana angulata TaxID=2784310 RepID=UPI0022B1DE22|nr:adhesion G protein-coupled receptor E3-like [Crassostrea angulata]